MALELAVEFQHQFCQRAVIAACTKSLGEMGIALPLVNMLIELLQHAVQHTVTKELCLLFIQYAEVGGEIATTHRGQEIHILTEQGGTEGVHRLNIRLIDAVELAAQMLIVGIFCHAAGELGGDFAAEFRCGGFCVRNDEEVIDAALPIGDVGKEALHQHLRFTRACGGGHEKAAAAIFNSAALFGGQFYLSHGQPPPPSFPPPTAKIPRALSFSSTAYRPSLCQSSRRRQRDSNHRPYSEGRGHRDLYQCCRC